MVAVCKGELQMGCGRIREKNEKSQRWTVKVERKIERKEEGKEERKKEREREKGEEGKKWRPVQK